MRPFAVLALALAACRAHPPADAGPSRAQAPSERRQEAEATPEQLFDEAGRLVAADRGVAHMVGEVSIHTFWRAGQEPRGVVMVLVPARFEPGDVAVVGNCLLDAGFNVSLVGALAMVRRPLDEGLDVARMDGERLSMSRRISAASGLARDKNLGARQRIEDGRPWRSTASILWIYEGPEPAALAVLRADVPDADGAVVLGGVADVRRTSIIDARGRWLPVLEHPAELGRCGRDGVWRPVLEFLDGLQPGARSR